MTMYTVEVNGNNYDVLNAETGEVIATSNRLRPYELLEFAGCKLEKVLDEFCVRVHEDVRIAFLDARERFREDFPDKQCPPFFRRKDTDYVYLYSSISDPSRVAGVTKRKYADMLRQEVVDAILRQVDGGIGWLTLHIQRIKEVGMKDWLMMGYINMSLNDFTDDWLQRNGVMLKPGKAVKNMTDEGADVSVFAGYFQDEMNKLNPDQCEILISDTPSEIYIMGGNFTSCMRKDDPDFFQIYDDVDACSIAYIVEYNQLKARALLWKDVEDLDTGRRYNVMDRIYAENHKYQSAMILWATTHGYLHKTAQALNIDTYYKPDLTIVTLKNARVDTRFRFEDEMYSLVPYVDTFQWVFNGLQGMYTTEKHAGGACLVNTEGDGEWLTTAITTCRQCGYSLDEDSVIYDDNGEAWCELCFNNHYTRCEQCDEYYRNHEVSEVSINGEPRQLICTNCLENYFHEEWSDAYWDNDHSFHAVDMNRNEIRISRERFEDEGIWFQCARCNGVFHEALIDYEIHETCQDCGDDIRFIKRLEETK